MGERITEQKLKNKRFRKTEEAIILAFFTTKEILNVDRLIKTAGISRSTLYRHHRTFYEILPDYKHYILRKYNRIFRRTLKNKRTRLSIVYREMLIFIRAHHKIVEFILKYGDANLIEEMIMIIKPKVASTSKITDPEMFAIYSKEVSEIIKRWVLNGSDRTGIAELVHKIMYLTHSAKSHLSPITNN